MLTVIQKGLRVHGEGEGRNQGIRGPRQESEYPMSKYRNGCANASLGKKPAIWLPQADHRAQAPVRACYQPQEGLPALPRAADAAAAAGQEIHHPRRLAHNRLVTRPKQLWEADVKYGYIAGEDRFFFVMPILDVYDRPVVEFHIGLTCQAEGVANALIEAVRRRKPE